VSDSLPKKPDLSRLGVVPVTSKGETSGSLQPATLEAKLSEYRQSLQTARVRRQQLLDEADKMRSQIDAHMGAIQAVEDLLRSVLPQYETAPTMARGKENEDG